MLLRTAVYMKNVQCKSGQNEMDNKLRKLEIVKLKHVDFTLVSNTIHIFTQQLFLFTIHFFKISHLYKMYIESSFIIKCINLRALRS